MTSTKPNFKKNLNKVLIFVGGVILTLIISKIWNIALPESPVVVKEITDSLRVIHEYTIPLEGDSLEKNVEQRLKNLKLLNDYEQEIQKRKKIIETEYQNILTPNLVLLNGPSKKVNKGYIDADASSYFSLDCPNLNTAKFLDFRLDFFNPEILKDVAYLRLSILKYKSFNEIYPIYLYFSEYYEVRPTNENFIRIENNLPKGKYEIFVGLALKRDVNAEYPTYYSKKFIRVRE